MEVPNTLWKERNGKVKDKIFLYFFNEPPLHVQFASEPVTSQLVMALLKEWKCDDVVNLDGKQIGGHVPTFELVGEKEKADVRVMFGGTYLVN